MLKALLKRRKHGFVFHKIYSYQICVHLSTEESALQFEDSQNQCDKITSEILWNIRE